MLLPPSWYPSEADVICGRGSIALQHVGNQRLKALVTSLIPQYNGSKCKFQKSSLVSSIVASVQQASPTGGFVKFDSDENAWIRVSERHAREKVGQIFRDSLSGKYKSSTLAKSQKRRIKLAGSGDDSSGASTCTHQQEGWQSESPLPLGPPSAAVDACHQSVPHLNKARPAPIPRNPPSVISVNYATMSDDQNRSGRASNSPQHANFGNQMAILGEIEPLPINSTEDVSLLENMFDLEFVADESKSFFQSLTEKNIDELCDFLFDECL